MKTRLKELFFGGIGGIFIGLFFSMIISFFTIQLIYRFILAHLSVTSF